jgi:hypothetical protein
LAKQFQAKVKKPVRQADGCGQAGRGGLTVACGQAINSQAWDQQIAARVRAIPQARNLAQGDVNLDHERGPIAGSRNPGASASGMAGAENDQTRSSSSYPGGGGRSGDGLAGDRSLSQRAYYARNHRCLDGPDHRRTDPSQATQRRLMPGTGTTGQALVRPARQWAGRCNHRRYCRRRHQRAGPGDRSGPPGRAAPVSLAGSVQANYRSVGLSDGPAATYATSDRGINRGIGGQRPLLLGKISSDLKGKP